MRLVDRTGSDWQAEVRRALGPGADVAVLAAPGGYDFAMSMVIDGGRMGSITDEMLPEERGIKTHYHVVRSDGAQLAELGAMAGDGKLRLPGVRTFPLHEAGQAMRMVRNGSGGDAIVLLT